MSGHRVVPVTTGRRQVPPGPYRWRCVHCGDRWMVPPELDDECDTVDVLPTFVEWTP